MSIQLPDDLVPFVAQRVTTGAYPSQDDVIRAAFSLLEERERLVQQIEAGFEQIKAGQCIEYLPDSLPKFLANIRAKSDEILRAARAQ
ncbi:MAG TPA: type II toxin-antitoxin system ParD family antitoxin [Pirellulales bacterium]|nr:type II toxin-antitoxin system ParD family antitoxin [Pirellulales bacterium]